jgi:phospholipid/cholesterol/gamma-HCH transport system permease protein
MLICRRSGGKPRADDIPRSPGHDMEGVVEADLKSTMRDGRLTLVAAGAWIAPHARALEPLLDAANRAAHDVKAVDLDVKAIDRLDTYGAWLIERLIRSLAVQGCDARLLGLPEHRRRLIDEVGRANRAAGPHLGKENPIAAALVVIGRAVTDVARDLMHFMQMLGELSAVLLRVVARPRTFRFTSVVHHLDRVGWRAVPIMVLITFLIGSIIAQQGIFHFRKFGADLYVVDMVGILILREVGVLIVTIMVAGRSGSAYTAELGSMKMREEVDALRTMGIDPVEVLILPRILALVIALPLLAFLGSMAALYGGGLVCWLYGGISPENFLTRLKEAVSLNTFEVGMIKAPFMALIIGIVASVEGLNVKGSAESLGLQTTASVVKSIFAVIVLDGLFAVFFASIGM